MRFRESILHTTVFGLYALGYIVAYEECVGKGSLACRGIFRPLLLVAALVSGDQLATSNTVYAAQDAVAAPTVLKVEGALPNPLSLTAATWRRCPRYRSP